MTFVKPLDMLSASVPLLFYQDDGDIALHRAEVCAASCKLFQAPDFKDDPGYTNGPFTFTDEYRHGSFSLADPKHSVKVLLEISGE